MLEIDTPALTRLFRLYAERKDLGATYAAEPLVRGARGAVALNPAARCLATVDVEIGQLEDRFGMNPRARLRLGLEAGRARETLESLFGGDPDKGVTTVTAALRPP